MKKTPKRRITVSTYTNRNGEAKVTIQFPREDALEIAMGTQEGYTHLEALRVAITERIEREEQPDVG